MADIIVELDQQDHLEFDLKQEDQRDIDLKEIKAVVIGGIEYEEDPVDSGFVWYNEQTDMYSTITPDDVVTADGENVVKSKAIYDYVETYGGKIDTISVNGTNIPVDDNKNVNIDLSGKADKSDIETVLNESKSYTETKVADLVNSAPETLDTLGEVAKAIQENENIVDALNDAIGKKQNKLIAGDNIIINEDNVISATVGGDVSFSLADLPEYTSNIDVDMSKISALAGTITLPIVSSSNFVVNWGDGTITEYANATTSLSHSYSDTSFKGKINIYGDWNGIAFSSSSNPNKGVIVGVEYDDNITDIPAYAFYGCTALKAIKLPKLIYEIGNYAFYNCTGLYNVDFQYGYVYKVGQYAFAKCTNLLYSELPYMGSVGYYMLAECSRLRDINTIRSGLIGSYMFQKCTGLKSFVIHADISQIGANAFNGCTNLKTIEVERTGTVPTLQSTSFPTTVTTIFVPGTDLALYKKASNWTTLANKIYPKGGNYSETITIPVSSWNATTKIATVTSIGATTEDRNVITWNVSSGGVQVENTYGLKCTAQGTMQLTFSCETIPTEDVEVSVRYMLTNY